MPAPKFLGKSPFSYSVLFLWSAPHAVSNSDNSLNNTQLPAALTIPEALRYADKYSSPLPLLRLNGHPSAEPLAARFQDLPIIV